MTELEKIAYAKSFIDKLANGINPLDDAPIPDGDIVNNVRLSRCFFYVSDILKQVIENGALAGKKGKKVRRSQFYITRDQLAQFDYSETPICITELAQRINNLIDAKQVKKLSYKRIVNWLVSIHALVEQQEADGKVKKYPTEGGQQLGIFSETRQGQSGEYVVVLYNKEAQTFILDNIEAILSHEDDEKENV
ncbi:MAG: hypothetical protein J6D16_07100 [Clostridia bacterium]|nr:hypothetical protein [Clostridia bacterium]